MQQAGRQFIQELAHTHTQKTILKLRTLYSSIRWLTGWLAGQLWSHGLCKAIALALTLPGPASFTSRSHSGQRTTFETAAPRPRWVGAPIQLRIVTHRPLEEVRAPAGSIGSFCAGTLGHTNALEIFFATLKRTHTRTTRAHW